jgi:hypothetical protein
MGSIQAKWIFDISLHLVPAYIFLDSRPALDSLSLNNGVSRGNVADKRFDALSDAEGDFRDST